MAKYQISSWKQAQDHIRSILEQINSDPNVALAAAANPLLALDELGYEIAPEVRQEFADRVRFGSEKADRLRALRQSMFERAGKQFDPDSAEDLRRVLFEHLRIPAPQAEGAAHPARQHYPSPPDRIVDTAPLPPQVRWGRAMEDPLEVLRGTHAVLEPLLEYRRLEASEPRLASRALYDEVRQGKRRLPITRLRAVLKATD